MKIFKRKKWYNKRVNRWNGKDMVQATGWITLMTTALAGLPFIGYLIKEKLD